MSAGEMLNRKRQKVQTRSPPLFSVGNPLLVLRSAPSVAVIDIQEHTLLLLFPHVKIESGYDYAFTICFLFHLLQISTYEFAFYLL